MDDLPSNIYYLVNLKTKVTKILRLHTHELSEILDQGYISVSYSALHDYREQFIAQSHARIRKTELQRLRRNQGAGYIKPPKPPKSK